MPYDIRFNPEKMMDVTGRVKMSRHQNIYDADFEYGTQPLRWESLTVGSGSITHMPGLGGVRMRVTTAAGDLTIRQSRPYHRYQPGKTLFMATAVHFGPAQTNQRQRVGFFDDSNGLFFEQADPTPANPFGMFVVLRTDVSGTVVDTRIPLTDWSCDPLTRALLNWNRIQMVFIEYAWYGAGALRWGAYINGEPFVLHQIGRGNTVNADTPWSRTGNLPVRYEQRNLAAVAAQNDMIHWGVSVLVEGGSDDQRGFTYSYGPLNTAPRRAVANGANRFPLLSVRGRVMGTQEFTQAGAAISAGTTTSLTVTGTPWTVDQWRGRMVAYGAAGATPTIARVLSNTANVLTIADPITGAALATAPVAGNNYTIGLVNRGQLLPRRLQFTSDQPALVELFVSTPPGSPGPIALTGATFVPLSSLGSPSSFAERDVSATSFTGGECVYSLFVPSNNPVDQPIDNLFPLVNTIRGNVVDVMTVAVSNTALSGSTANVSCQIIAQEAMS